jgi:hypothetical protein
MLIKGVIPLQVITIVSLYVPNIGGPNFIRHIILDLKAQIPPKTVTVRDFNIPLSLKTGYSPKKINKETLELNDTRD